MMVYYRATRSLLSSLGRKVRRRGVSGWSVEDDEFLLLWWKVEGGGGRTVCEWIDWGGGIDIGIGGFVDWTESLHRTNPLPLSVHSRPLIFCPLIFGRSSSFHQLLMFGGFPPPHQPLIFPSNR